MNGRLIRAGKCEPEGHPLVGQVRFGKDAERCVSLLGFARTTSLQHLS